MAAPPSEIQSEKPFLEQLKSFGPIYWIADWMELVERFAYYGVRVVLPVFMVAVFEKGGPQFDHIQKGMIYSIWALVQSFVPIMGGGFADRYGYKINIAVSTVLKMIGYLLMGYCIVLAEKMAGMSLAEARPKNLDRTYEIFFAGAMFLALGTAIFKPAVQGLIANHMPKESASLGWGVFYQMVNIGGFAGPLVAGYLRVISWEYVFLACTGAIALNFIPLFFFKEPSRASQDGDDDGPMMLLYRAIKGLLEPRLFFFTVTFAGFWLMFYQLFDILSNFINDWIDSRAPAAALQSILGDGAVPTINGGNLTQEWMINANALLISLFAFAMGFITGKVRALNAIVVGIAISAIGIYALGMSMSGWWILGAILLFSVGEMAASPTKMRYLSNIAPSNKQGLYMGYANFTVGIGWSIGSSVAGYMYQTSGDKVVLARRYLVDKLGMAKETVAELAKNDVMPMFEKAAEVDAWGARQLLWDTYEPYGMWKIFTMIGLGSMVLIMAYNWLVVQADKDPNHSFNTQGRKWVLGGLIPIVLTLGTFTAISWAEAGIKDALALLLNTLFFAMMLAVALLDKSSGTVEK